MRHLTSEQLVDVAEGQVASPAEEHLRSCDACRVKVAELRAMRTMALQADEVPEPSPLFWDHLSARVHDAVAAEEGYASRGGIQPYGHGSRYRRPARSSSRLRWAGFSPGVSRRRPPPQASSRRWRIHPSPAPRRQLPTTRR